MKYNILILTIIAIFCSCNSTQKLEKGLNTIHSDEIDLLVGEWAGTLTYLDYKTKEPYSMPANLKVKKSTTNNRLIVENIYPNEPSANSSSQFIISNDSTAINHQPIISRTVLETGEIELITEHIEKDDGKKATIQHSYLISSSTYSNTKRVRYESGKDWILRNEFSFKRKK